MLSLPIPDEDSPTRYRDLLWQGRPVVGAIVEALTNGRITAAAGAHIDPDLDRSALTRERGWRPLLGQTGAAQGHLQNQGVRSGDVFVFFGLFQNVRKHGGVLRVLRDSTPQHVIFGWLQVGEVLFVDRCSQNSLKWAAYHPHTNREPDAQNTLYVACDHLQLPGRRGLKVPGAGVFSRYDPALRLTAPESAKPSLWLLPDWFHPKGRDSSLSYHGDTSRWTTADEAVLLQAVARGQEFILDCDDYPESADWLAELVVRSQASDCT
jgi:hypothetical protein